MLITGSGTGAVESMIAALVPAQGRLLVVENGVYGERIAQICAQYGIAHERVVGRLDAALPTGTRSPRALDRGLVHARRPSCTTRPPPAG